MTPYLRDKSKWPHKPDVMFHEFWPVRSPALLFAAIALILWLVWVYGIHKDLRVLSGGRHTISPGQAVGFSFLPLFDAFWAVYMPVRACGALNQHLAARGLRKASKGTVITCQLFSILFALAIPGLTPILYALSMRTIQKGMNRLIASPKTNST